MKKQIITLSLINFNLLIFFFQETCKDVIRDEKENTYSVLSLFKSPRLRKITILLILIW